MVAADGGGIAVAVIATAAAPLCIAAVAEAVAGRRRGCRRVRFADADTAVTGGGRHGLRETWRRALSGTVIADANVADAVIAEVVVTDAAIADAVIAVASA